MKRVMQILVVMLLGMGTNIYAEGTTLKEIREKQKEYEKFAEYVKEIKPILEKYDICEKNDFNITAYATTIQYILHGDCKVTAKVASSENGAFERIGDNLEKVTKDILSKLRYKGLFFRSIKYNKLLYKEDDKGYLNCGTSELFASMGISEMIGNTPSSIKDLLNKDKAYTCLGESLLDDCRASKFIFISHFGSRDDIEYRIKKVNDSCTMTYQNIFHKTSYTLKNIPIQASFEKEYGLKEDNKGALGFSAMLLARKTNADADVNIFKRDLAQKEKYWKEIKPILEKQTREQNYDFNITAYDRVIEYSFAKRSPIVAKVSYSEHGSFTVVGSDIIKITNKVLTRLFHKGLSHASVKFNKGLYKKDKEGYINCGASELFMEVRGRLDFETEGVRELLNNDKVLTCFGEKLLDNCKPAKMIILSDKRRTSQYSIKKVDDNCSLSIDSVYNEKISLTLPGLSYFLTPPPEFRIALMIYERLEKEYGGIANNKGVFAYIIPSFVIRMTARH